LQIRLAGPQGQRAIDLPPQTAPKGQWHDCETSVDLPVDFPWENARLAIFAIDDGHQESSGGPLVIDELYVGMDNGPNLVSGSGTLLEPANASKGTVRKP
jgi:hypothetical protein